jgi:citrate lyase subunit gamma (acyl carrier protein)
MQIIKPAIAGTTESSDVQIMISPNNGNGIEINLNSIVKTQFGDSILETVKEVLEAFDVKDAIIQIQDKGAFDWVIRARMQSALCRGAETPFDWKQVE